MSGETYQMARRLSKRPAERARQNPRGTGIENPRERNREPVQEPMAVNARAEVLVKCAGGSELEAAGQSRSCQWRSTQGARNQPLRGPRILVRIASGGLGLP
jgi:hypothetical protein